MRKKEEFLIKLRQVWSPAVVVIESEEIRNLCTSGVVSSFTDLLRPWESIEGLNTGLGGRN
jgi:hypothetical protein